MTVPPWLSASCYRGLMQAHVTLQITKSRRKDRAGPQMTNDGLERGTLAPDNWPEEIAGGPFCCSQSGGLLRDIALL